jgi:hypothetical protein
MRPHLPHGSRPSTWITAGWRTRRSLATDEGGETGRRTPLRRAGGIGLAVASIGLLIGAGAAGFSGGNSTHVVQPGDTLWAISRADGLTVAQLAAANNMNPNDLLLVGRRLLIPTPGSQSSSGQSSGRQASGGKSPGAQASGARSAPSESAGGRTATNARTFCSTFVPQSTGSWGVLPYLLQQSPPRLALRPLFERWAGYYGLSLPLLEAVAWQESGWQQNVVSSAGAVGTGQILPSTASFVSTLVGQQLNIHSASDNIRISAALLSFLADIEGNNRCDVIAAYYEGALNLSHYGVFPETQAYVANVEALIPEFE